MRNQFSTHRGHAGECGDAFAFNEFKGATWVPFVGEHDFSADQRAWLQEAVVRRNVEQRCWRHIHRLTSRIGEIAHLFALNIACSLCFCLSSSGSQAHEDKIHDIVYRASVGELGALRETSRS